jgi:hypothetical protein
VWVSPGPSCPVRPFFTKPGGMKMNTRVRGTLAPEDSVRQEARRACSEWLRSLRPKRWVEGDLELPCSQVDDAKRPSPDASALADQNIPSVGLGCLVVPYHCLSITCEESPVSENVGRYPPPH